MSGLYVFISVMILIVCVLLVLVVLVQNSKGGGLASNFGSSNQFMGVRKTADFLEKSTWTLAVALLVLSLLSIFVIPKYTGTGDTRESIVKKQLEESGAAQPIKDFEAPPEQPAQPGE
ncbi:MAG: preprotein translocase subunit SecG [Bacteroidetes bacterium]|nr:preprotein translocase subunit SecG [Bacteroidota bacterium]